MEFGLVTLFDFYSGKQNEARYYHETLDLVVRGEQLGYRSLWVGEEHFYAFGVCPSPQLFLAAVAQKTQCMRLGTSVSVLPLDHPLRKAEDFAMLDILSNGRLNFGAARGAIGAHFAGFNIDPNESKARYEEALEIIQKAWTQERVTHVGQFWQINNVSVSPKPLQKPCPPIYRGTVSDESYIVAGRAGQNAFTVPWTVGPFHEVRRRLDLYRQTLAEHGKGPTRTAALFLMFCDKDHQSAVSRAKTATDRYAKLITSHTQGKNLLRDPGSGLYKHAEFVLAASDQVEERAIVGTPRECIKRIKEIDEELGGLDQVCLYLHAGLVDAATARANIELFAREVMPYFQQTDGSGPLVSKTKPAIPA